MNNGYIFEETIMNILDQIASKNEKNIAKNYLTEWSLIFDGYAPYGVFDNIPTYIEIKETTSKKTIEQYIKILYAKIRNLNNNKFLLISKISNSDLKELKNKYDKYIELWGNDKVIELLNNFPVDSLNFIFEKKTQYIKSTDDLQYKNYENKNLANINKLCKYIVNNKISLILGTGVSFDFKAKSWKDLIKLLYSKIDSIKQFDNENESFKKIGDDLLTKGQYSKVMLNKSTYASTIYHALYSEYYKTPINNEFTLLQIAELIKNRKIINKVITYNYDNYLEIILDKYGVKYHSLINKEDYLNNSLPIYHVHGFLPINSKPNERQNYIDSIILTEDEYFNLYSNSNNWQVAIQLETFKDSICLFIGNSITDFNEKRLLNHTRQKFKKHFAIFSQDKLNYKDMCLINAYFFTTCNVEIIWVKTPKDISKFIKKYLVNQII